MMFAECSRFDWYQATVPGEVDDVIETLDLGYGDRAVAFEVEPPIRPYANGRKWVDCEGETIASIYWGGHNPLPHVRATGPEAVDLACILRSEFPEHRPSRVDVCADLQAPSLMRTLFPTLAELSRDYRLRFDRQGPALDDDRRDRGTTLYLGAPASPLRVRVYEKGLEQFEKSGRDRALLMLRDWVRIEMQWRPVRQAKPMAAQLEPGDMWGASAWTRTLAAACLQLDAEKVEASRFRVPNAERAMRAMVRQYGPTLDAMLARYGSPEAVWGAIRAIKGGRPIPAPKTLQNAA